MCHLLPALVIAENTELYYFRMINPFNCIKHKKFRTFLCIPAKGVILRTRLCSEVQVLSLCLALSIVVILAVCSRVFFSSVPGLFFTLMGFGAPAACDAVRVQAIGQLYGPAVCITQCVTTVAGAQYVAVH